LDQNIVVGKRKYVCKIVGVVGGVFTIGGLAALVGANSLWIGSIVMSIGASSLIQAYKQFYAEF